MLKMFSKLVLGFMLGAIVLFSSNIKDTYYRNITGASVVRVFNLEQTSGGTGFHIKSDKGVVYILTNKHVCGLASDTGLVKIEQNGKDYIRSVVKKYAKHDLCIIEPISQNEPVIDIAQNAEHGEDIIVVGHPGLRKLTLSHGEYIGQEIVNLVSLVDSPAECEGTIKEDLMVQFLYKKLLCVESFQSSAISSPVYGGNSGSPVVNKYGNVVGVVFAGNRSQPNDSYMVPLNFVKEFIKGF